jgi:hypothetical protein
MNASELVKELVYVGPHKAADKLFELVSSGECSKEDFHTCVSEVIFLVIEELVEESEETVLMQRLFASSEKVATC